MLSLVRQILVSILATCQMSTGWYWLSSLDRLWGPYSGQLLIWREFYRCCSASISRSCRSGSSSDSATPSPVNFSLGMVTQNFFSVNRQDFGISIQSYHAHIAIEQELQFLDTVLEKKIKRKSRGKCKSQASFNDRNFQFH